MIAISLVIPVLGDCEWLNETLESVIQQTFPRAGFETIIVADAAMRQRAAAAASLLDAHAVRTAVVTQHHGKAATARNTGWRASAGEWIQFLDSGDIIASDKLELQASALGQLSADVDVVCAKWRHLGLSNGRWEPFGPVVSPMFSDPVIVRLASPDRPGWVGPILIRKTALERVGGYTEEQDVAGDDRLIRQIAGSGGRIVELPSRSPLFLIRQLPGQRSRFWLRRARVARHSRGHPPAARPSSAAQPAARVVMGIALLPRRAALSVTTWLEAFPRLTESSLAAARGVGSEVARALAPTVGLAVSAAKAVLPPAGRLARLPLSASRAIATGVAAAAEWTVAGLGSGLRPLRDGALWLAKLPLIACHRIAASAGAAVASAHAQLAAATTVALEGGRWLARAPLNACRWGASGMGAAAAWTLARLAAAADAALEGVRWLGRLPLLAWRWIAASVATAATWTVALVVSTTTAAIRPFVWLARLSAAAFRSLLRSLLSRAAWISQRAASIGRRLSYAAESAWGARRPAVAALIAVAIVGGVVGLLRLDNPFAHIVRKASPPTGPLLADASAPQPRAEAPPIASRADPAPDPGPRLSQLQPLAPAMPADAGVKLSPGPGAPEPSGAPPAQQPSQASASAALPDLNAPDRPAGSATLAGTAITTAALPVRAPPLDQTPDAVTNPPLPQTAVGEPPADTPPATAGGLGSETPPSPAPPRAAGGDNTAETAKATEVAAIPASAGEPDRPGDAGRAQTASDQPGRASEQPAQVQPSAQDSNGPAASATRDAEQQTAPPPAAQAAAPVPPASSQPAATVEPAPADLPPRSVASLPNARPAPVDKTEAPASGPDMARVAEPSTQPATTTVVAAIEPAPVLPSAAEPAARAPTAETEGGSAKPRLLSPLEREQAEKLVARGERELGDGNIALARQFLLRAAKLGLARGALLLASTYDARELRRLAVVGVQPNEAMAREWYQQARALGATEADERLALLGTP